MKRGFPVLNLGVKCVPGYVPSGDPNKPCMLDPNSPDSPPPVTPPPMETNGQVYPQAPQEQPMPISNGAGPVDQAPIPVSGGQVAEEQASAPVPVVNQALPPEGTPKWVNSKSGDLGTTLAATAAVGALAAAGALFIK